ncbi:hypothetical protein [Rubellicoccus peritrichatus]|uniref:RNase III domain-containing protein n=1 Tax=Rubellicoccus peritrichatus TaxID=3080537 RepID=A0AAQ3QWR1_9BACT|nr:hypothetical protein [Puniceicoccus sp. CR14]WOO42105.1 hypothetical protein RZN69_03325 [Puniceicoccus sp. CR14]
MTEQQKRELAWIGDAVLALYARRWILKQSDIAPGERIEAFKQMTSNHFLSCFGQPTAIEAEIGSIHETDGLDAAFKHIESVLLPMFLKQRANRLRGTRR